MILPIVASKPPSPLSGRAKSMVCPFRSSPRDKSWLLMYSDAVRRLSASIACMPVVYLGWQKLEDVSHPWRGQRNNPRAFVNFFEDRHGRGCCVNNALDDRDVKDSTLPLARDELRPAPISNPIFCFPRIATATCPDLI